MQPVTLEYEGFEWDEGNLDKSWEKHSVEPREAEEIFADTALLLAMDVAHSQREARYIALGQTDEGRRLCCVFTTRKIKLRIISARSMSRKERNIYERTR